MSHKILLCLDDLLNLMFLFHVILFEFLIEIIFVCLLIYMRIFYLNLFLELLYLLFQNILFLFAFQKCNFYIYCSEKCRDDDVKHKTHHKTLDQLYKKKFGNCSFEILCYGFNIHSYNNKVKTLGTGSILSFWRKYKSEKLLNSSIFKEIQKEIKDLNVDKSSSGYGEHNLCPICFEKERNIVLIPCKHLFCESCFKLFENEFKCPLCRGKIIISKKF